MTDGDPTTARRPTGDQGGDPQTSGTLVAGAVGAIMVFVIIVALQAFFYRSQEAERKIKIDDVAPEELAKLRATQLEQLNSWRWVDRDRGIVAISIDRAMELTVRDQGRNPPVGTPPRGTPPVVPESGRR